MKYIKTTLLLCLIVAFHLSDSKGQFLSVTKGKTGSFSPLEKITVHTQLKGLIKVLDGKGDEYFSAACEDSVSFSVGGCLGTQIILFVDKKNRLLEQISFHVDCETGIYDRKGTYTELLDILYHSMTGGQKRESDIRKFNGNYYHTFVGWLRDHVHTLKGMKYFYPELKSGIDLYGDSQREDGMIWDNYTHKPGTYWEQRFAYGNFVKHFEGNDMIFTRIPVENDVEYLFIEGIYYTWKACGDDKWMRGMLDKALLAVDYARTNPFRWSEKYQLLKRGYTIDTWDFQNDEDAAISAGEGNLPDPMIIKPGLTRFGIMYGDNTGMMASARYLAEMLRYAERYEEAKEMEIFADGLEERVNKISWNGSFYTHHVPEQEGLVRDLGVDEKTQVSLSNAYSLNRGISHDKAAEIIKTYQHIKASMPESSPGEFYTIYPPFEKGYGTHNSKWNYMNGGVISIVAGELAHGAFEHGFEEYGVDILNRSLELARSTNNYLHSTYRGKMPEEPLRTFYPVSLKDVANIDIKGNTVEGVKGWTGEGENDLHEFPVEQSHFNGIQFAVVDPKLNNRKVCLGLSNEEGYKTTASLKINQKAKSLYLLHTTNNAAYCGSLTLRYKDGSSFTEYITNGKITHWWYPHAPAYRKQMPRLQLAWIGKNKMSDKVGVGNYGINNPYPDKIIEEILFKGAENGAKWMVLGLSLSDYEVFFTPGMISGGIPDNWGAAAVVYALVEGLAGVVDQGVKYDQTLIAPRWEAAEENMARLNITYEASGGYVSYIYEKTEDCLKLDFTGTATNTRLHILLPENLKVTSVTLNDKNANYEIITIEDSHYLQCQADGKRSHELMVRFNPSPESK